MDKRSIPAPLAEVEGAAGPSRELDARIALHFGWTRERDREVFAPHHEPPWAWTDPDGFSCGHVRDEGAPVALTSSIDAALALVERVLPGWGWGVFVRGGLVQADVCKTSPLRPMPIVAKGCATPALAILSALLRALDARHTDGGSDA